jgi:hypothetical protein
MTEPINAPPPHGDAGRTWDDRLAGPMFFLALMFLVVLAGLIHRYPRLDPHSPEAYLILGALGVLWLPLLLDAVVRYRLRDRADRSWKPLLAAAAFALVPPLRMGRRGRVRPGHIWLPVLGWREVDHHLRRTLERLFSVPMIGFALMVLPLLALEYWWAEALREEPVLALLFDIGTAAVWLAFSVELIVMVAVSDRPVQYCFLHWIDVAIVLFPTVEVLPAFRLLRLGRILRLEELLRWGRLHRLQALASRGWRAFLLLQIVQRLTGRSLEHRLEQLRGLLRAKEEEAADLREEIGKLEDRIARRALRRSAAAAPSPQERATRNDPPPAPLLPPAAGRSPSPL